MSTTLLVSKLANVNGLARDEVVNTFVVAKAGAMSGADLTAAAEALVDFWTDGLTSGGTIGGRLSPVIDRTAAGGAIETYDLASLDPAVPHGSPTSFSTFSIPAASSAVGLPNEVAIALSYKADLTGILEVGPSAAIPTPEAAQDMGAPATHTGRTKPRARRRGHVLLGPWNNGVLGSPSTGWTVVDNGAIADIAEAASRLKTDWAGQGLNWVVWSRRDLATYAITGGWVDAEFDTVRKRGRKSGAAKTTWS